jgi:hypothetical protein
MLSLKAMEDFVLTWAEPVAAIVTCAAAVSALVYAHLQIVAGKQAELENAKLAKEMDALNAYERYHELMLAHPDLAMNFDFLNASEKEQNRYIVFVMSMMLTVERVLVLLPNDENWEPALRDDLRMHKQFLCSPLWAHELVQCINPVVEEFIERVAEEEAWPYRFRRRTQPSAPTATPSEEAVIGLA